MIEPIKKVRPVEILLVEDNEGDVMLTRRAFQKGKIANNIHHASDGEIAMDMLLKKEAYAGLPTPDIILLDLNLPKLNGKEILERIKAEDSLKRIPVVVLTSSQADKDVFESYDLQAASYLIKPINAEKFKEVVEAIENFWFTVVVLPTEL